MFQAVNTLVLGSVSQLGILGPMKPPDQVAQGLALLCEVSKQGTGE